MTTYNRIAILGLGLIGSSIARAVTEKKIAEHVAAFDISSQSLDFAINQGFVDSIYLQASQAVENADLIIFATPPQYFSEIMEEIAKNIKPGAIITDVGSVKLSAIADITEYLPEHAQFVPAHPIAGSENSGVEAGDANLFVGKRVILTPGKANLQSDAVKN
ncbi:MAG: prephenate dehydrogenase/arogenate dehydrogenase family protein, partial [Pseudomonadota bacterium]